MLYQMIQVFSDKLQNRCHAVRIGFAVEIQRTSEKVAGAVGQIEIVVRGRVPTNVVQEAAGTAIFIGNGDFENVLGLYSMFKGKPAAVGVQGIELNQIMYRMVGYM